MISVIIPIYNAGNIISGSYKILKNKLEEIGEDYEIIFEDDGSFDRSKDILKELARREQKVRAFFHFPNQGLGFTLRQLFKYARGNIIIYLDIDLSFGTENLPKLIGELKYADVIVASRYAGLKSRISIVREITSRLYYVFCKALFDISVKDIGSGLVVFKKDALDKVILLSKGFDIHIELFIQLQKHGFVIKEIPLKYASNGYSTFSVWKYGWGILIQTLKFWLKINENLPA